MEDPTTFILTSVVTWDTNILDNIISEDEKQFDAVSDHVDDISPLFDIYGYYNQRYEVHNVSVNGYNLGYGNIPINDTPYIINTSESTQVELIQPRNVHTEKKQTPLHTFHTLYGSL